ncbi:MAG: hypothetical protein ACREU3_05330 [Steroidobacteraceae bacterium]
MNAISGIAPGAGSTQALATGRTNETTLGLTAGIGETDNVFLDSSGSQSQTLATAGLDLVVTRHAPRLNTAMVGDFQDFYYAQGAYGNQLVGRFDGDGTFGIVPGRLNWAVDESFGQNQVDPTSPTVPTNLENVNVISTGPDLQLHPGSPANILELGARYARSDYQKSPFDGYQELGLLTLGRDLSQASTIELSVTDGAMYFRNMVANHDYTLRAANLSYSVRGARTQIVAEAGVAQANDAGNSWTTRPVGELTLSRRLTPTLTLQLSGGRQITNAADEFSSLQSGAARNIVVGPVYGTTGSYARTFGSAGLSFDFNRTSFGASASWEQDSYDAAPLLDARLSDYELRAERRLAPRLSVVLSGVLSKANYNSASFEDDQRSVDVAMAYQTAPHLQLALEYRYTSQQSGGLSSILTRGGYFNPSNPASLYANDSYATNIVFLTLTYRPFGS